MILLTLFTLVLVYLVRYCYKKWTVYRYLLRHFKCPPRHPLFGNLHLFPATSQGIFQTFQKFHGIYGKNYAIVRPLIHARIIVCDAQDAETILSNPNTKRAKKAAFYGSFEPWLGTGLLTAHGNKWFTRRRILTPSFHFSILDGFVEVMGKQSNILVEHLRAQVDQAEFDIYPIINAFALDVICETSMGVKVNAQSDPHSNYATSVKKISEAILQRLHHPLGRYRLYDFTAQGKYLRQLTNVLHAFTDKVIQDRRDQLLSNDGSENAPSGRMNFLDILLHATVDGKPLTNADIREEVDTFMFEGHDTTASGIAFTLYLLARHAEVQEKVYQEVKEVIANKTEIELNSKELNKLIYLDMVIKESLRMYPPVPAVGRELTEDTVIGGVTVPSGVEIHISIYGIQHHPDYYPDPEQFDPERFNPSRLENKRNFSYIPFSAGGRNCIGQKLAMLDMKISIAKILTHFRLLPGSEIILQGNMILKATNGISVRLQERLNK